MKRFQWMGLAILLPSLAVLIMSAGCKDSKDPDKPSVKSGSDIGATKASSAGKKEEVASKGWGTLKGKVTYDGTSLPSIKKDIVDDANKDKDYCRKATESEKAQQNWKIGPDKGVANVVIWLRAPKGKYFKIPDDQKERHDTVKIDQPHCAFIPHVVALYPSYFDGKEQKRTGQKFEVVNSAQITHNTNWNADDATLIKGDNVIMPSKSGDRQIEVRASKDKNSGGEQKLKLNCNIHGWMTGYAWVFDHPFVAVSSGDKPDAKEFGNYEIKEAPADAELELVYWHESLDAPQVIKKITLKDGDNSEDIKIK